MAFNSRITNFLARNTPAVMLVAVGCFSFNTAILFDQALYGWLRNDRLWWLSAVFAALSLLAAMSNGLALVVWIKQQAKTTG